MKSITTDEALELCRRDELLSAQDRSRLITERLRDLVEYAREHSAYFREAYKDIGDDFTLEGLPTTSKDALMADYSAWVTDPEVTEEGVRAYVVSDEAAEKPYLGKYTALTTSGTTGNPMPMVRDTYHNAIHGAMIQTRLLRNVDPDLMSPVTHKIASLIILDPAVSSYSSLLRIERANPGYEENVRAISLLDDIDEIAEQLNEFQPDLITGYPSVMAVLAKAAQDGKLSIQPQALACSAETLTDQVYKTLRSAFGTPVLNNYCSTEGGEAAMSCSEGKFHVNEDWVIIEPVDKDGNPVPDGTWSDGIYITDLTNYVQPIIRYHMGDKVRFVNEPCSCGSRFRRMEILGREVEQVTVGGKILIGPIFEQALENLPGVLAVQLAQKKDREFIVRLVPTREEDREETAQKVKDTVLGLFEKGGFGTVDVTVSAERPVPGKRGGKVKFLVKELENS